MKDLQFVPLTKANREKVFANLAGKEGVAYLKGGETIVRKWTDTEKGVSLPGFHLVLDFVSKESHLFIPKFDDDHVVWCGQSYSLASAKAHFKIDHVHYDTDLVKVLIELNPLQIYAFQGTDLVSLNAEPSFSSKINFQLLSLAVIEARVLKSAGEIEIMREAARISGNAHVALMRSVKPNTNSELQLHAKFEYECFSNGAQHQAYTPIVACGKAAAVLHYIKNDSPISKNPDDLLLVDAGCELFCYASDITRTYPVGGKFHGDFKTTYEIVLAAQMAVLEALKPGVEWEDMHRLANRVICEGLQKAGILVGSTEELIKNHIPALFFPHGLGHFLGIDVHDCGGYPVGVERILEPGIRYLRMRRTLKPNMVVTVEPGCYFIDAILEPAVGNPEVNKFLNLEVLARFRNSVGGVRIEDDVVITETGIDNLSGWIPKTVEEIEKTMNSNIWNSGIKRRL